MRNSWSARKLLWLGSVVTLLLISAALGARYWQSAAHAQTPTAQGGMRAGPYYLMFNIDPATPQEGVNRLTLEVRDANGKNIAHARVEISAHMAAMGTMPAMHVPAELREAAAGVYRGTLDIPMSGEWPLTVAIDTPELGHAEIVLDLATGRKGVVPANAAPRSSAGTPQEMESGVIQLDTRRRQLIGVTTGHVERKAVNYTVRAAGRVASDERRLSDVALKFNGFIGTLHANYVGAQVRKGEPLFTVFSPTLLNMQLEYLSAYRTREIHDGGSGLLKAARERLLLWDVTPEQIHDLEVRDKPLDYLPILSPVDGIVMEKMVVAGSAFNAGDKLLRISDLSRVWVEAQAYQFELPLLKTGIPAEITFPEDPKHVLHGVVSYVAPYLEGDTRSVRIRVELDNKDGALRPDMYADVQLAVPLGQRLVVPEDAVLYSGANRVVFLDLLGNQAQGRA
ncbi:MAG: efflux RND transporter periplasmic adaptor subunit [Gammaproteobacteria bacterium]|nr:efflux RND transporter periplasmic adaptor subunit [Gammaproteobacteria bacterium]